MRAISPLAKVVVQVGHFAIGGMKKSCNLRVRQQFGALSHPEALLCNERDRPSRKEGGIQGEAERGVKLLHLAQIVECNTKKPLRADTGGPYSLW